MSAKSAELEPETNVADPSSALAVMHGAAVARRGREVFAMTLARDLGLDRAQARAAFGAVRHVIEESGPVTLRGRELLDVARQTLEVDANELEAISFGPAAVAAAFPSSAARRVMVDALLLIPAAIDEQVSLAGERIVRRYAEVLGVASHWVELLPAMRQRRVFAVKRELFRRAPDARRVLERTWSEDGLPGVGRALLFTLGLHRDAALARRFRALGSLAPGTLGRTFFDDFVARGLEFPGEAGGLPEKMIHHDLMHVVNGYGTDPEGECEIAGFYAGTASGDAFTFVVIALTTFHLGMQVSPSIVTPARGAFHPSRVLAAFLRGRRMRVDVMGQWDYWALMPLTIEAARETLGIDDARDAPADRAR